MEGMKGMKGIKSITGIKSFTKIYLTLPMKITVVSIALPFVTMEPCASK